MPYGSSSYGGVPYGCSIFLVVPAGEVYQEGVEASVEPTAEGRAYQEGVEAGVTPSAPEGRVYQEGVEAGVHTTSTGFVFQLGIEVAVPLPTPIPPPVPHVFPGPIRRRTPQWVWYLARSSDMELLGVLNTVRNRQLQLALNSTESGSCTLSLLDPIAPQVEEITTCIVAVRDGVIRWSGPVTTVQEQGSSAQMSIGCLGWYSFVNSWELKTGSNVVTVKGEYDAMTTTATSQTYEITSGPGQDQCQVGADLLLRGAFDATQNGAPTYVSLGTVPTSGQPRNQTYQQFQPIGQAIVDLTNLEAGFDFSVDPQYRTFNMHYDPIWPIDGPYTVNGRGQVRPNAMFGYRAGPNNCSDFRKNRDCSPGNIVNQDYAVGQYATGLGYDADAIAEYGLFTANSSLSDVVVTQILTAYANAEVQVKKAGQTTYGWDQSPFTADGSMLAPWDDFDIGDFVYCMADYGSLQVGLSSPQPARIFAFTLNIDDEGNEQCTNFQTTFQEAA